MLDYIKNERCTKFKLIGFGRGAPPQARGSYGKFSPLLPDDASRFIRGPRHSRCGAGTTLPIRWAHARASPLRVPVKTASKSLIGSDPINRRVRKRQRVPASPVSDLAHDDRLALGRGREVDEIVRASRLPAAIAFGCMPGDHSFDLELAACVLLTSLS